VTDGTPPASPAPRATLNRTGFWFLRHGQTDWNARDLSQGNVDIPLNETGLAQAHAAAARLRGRGIASIFSSPLSRARVTAEIAGDALGLPVVVEDGLREVAFGVQEGQPMAGWFQEWVAGRLTPEGAESFSSLRDRGVEAINGALGYPPAVLVVAHGALFRAVRAAMGMEPNIRTQNAVPIFCHPPVAEGGAWTLEPVS
jgi:broad specificity phosphatase PhoE